MLVIIKHNMHLNFSKEKTFKYVYLTMTINNGTRIIFIYMLPIPFYNHEHRSWEIYLYSMQKLMKKTYQYQYIIEHAAKRYVWDLSELSDRLVSIQVKH